MAGQRQRRHRPDGQPTHGDQSKEGSDAVHRTHGGPTRLVVAILGLAVAANLAGAGTALALRADTPASRLLAPPSPRPAPDQPAVAAARHGPATPATPPTPVASPVDLEAGARADRAHAARTVTEPAPPRALPDWALASADLFAREFPRHAAATASPGDPASNFWAVLVGINDYAGGTRDNIGSYQDALALRDALMARGWRADHVLVLGERDATRDRVVRALEWLVRSTDAESTVVFSYSGHTRQRAGDPDGDGEDLDEGLWAADNGTIWDAELGRLLGAVVARRMWITVQACEAAGFNDTGVEGPGRLVTYSSLESEKSHEDPEVGFSVMGYYAWVEGFLHRFADDDGDGRTSVQEAYAWGAPRTTQRTAGLQTPVIVDGVGAPFFLEATPAA